MASGDPTTLQGTATRSSIFLKLQTSDAGPREVAWRQFYDRYAPVISGYARRKGASAQQADEVVQNVISGFFEASPRFVYDPAQGRFRGYLKSCVSRALARVNRRRSTAPTTPSSSGAAAAAARAAVSIDELELPDKRVDEQDLWERLWRQQLLRRAVEVARQHYSRKGKLKTFLAFEQNVLFGVPAADVAKDLGMKVNSVHAAKVRLTEKVRQIRAMLEEEEG
jgi:RNA polymerase sigma-70 factor, ECF subfamily